MRPTIGDYVAFGPGAKAFGKIIIGDNVFVASNSVVTKDVNPNCIVGGVPAKLIKETRIEDNVVYKKFANRCQNN
jgi:serine O-acetyltransferase